MLTQSNIQSSFKVLKIVKGDKFYSVQFQGKGREAIIDLFGSDIIPTPFTVTSSEETVLNAIQHINPDAIVMLA